MNALRKILNNLQKYATTATVIKNDVNAVIPLLPEKRSLEETDLDKETTGSEIGVNAATPQTMDTNKCLKEFEDILEEINKDVTKGASLDDIDDVLKDIAQADTKDFMFEVPRFDLAEISAAYESFKDDDVDINSLLTLDDSAVSLSDGYFANNIEVIEQNDVISISSEDRQRKGSVKNILTENTGNIEPNICVNSTNTEETKENTKYNESIKCEKLDNKYIGAEKDQCIEKQTTSHVATNEVIDKTNEPTDKTNEGIQNIPAESSKEENNLTTKDVVFMNDSDDCGYQSSDFEFITEEEAIMDGLILNFKKNTHKRKAAIVTQFSHAKKSHRRNKINHKTRKTDKDPDWAPESDTDSISDDEIIPDDREYLSTINTRSKNNNKPAKSPGRNNTVTFSLRQIRLPPKTYYSSPRFRNSHISSNTLTSRNITAYNVNVIQNNEERDNPDRNNDRHVSNIRGHEIAANARQIECNDESNLLKTETDDLELALINYPNANNQDLRKVPDLIKIIPESSFMQENRTDSNNMVIKTNGMQGGTEQNNIGPTLKSPEKNNFGSSDLQRPEENIIPGTSTQKVPDPSYLKPGPSEMQEIPKLDKFGSPSRFKRNRSKVDEIEKWRMYQMRTRVNRPQFVVDYSYRDNHRIYRDNDLHQLFDPNRAPLPTARSIGLLENKSTVCKNSMLVEYQGVGFDVPLRDSGSEDDEVKREANGCAQKILEMYPGQNTRRPHRRRF